MIFAELLNLATFGCLAAVLVAVIYFDLRQMRIPNVLSYLLLSLFVVQQVSVGIAPDLWPRLGFSACVFAAGFAGFILRVVGGGDVKILTALALFLPMAHLPIIMLVFSASIVVGTSAVLLCRRALAGPDNAWAFLSTNRMPMGLPIGLAGLTALMMIGLGG